MARPCPIIQTLSRFYPDKTKGQLISKANFVVLI